MKRDGAPDILVLVGSPHVGGASTKLAEAVCAAFEERGVAPTYWHLAEYPVAACTNCGSCLRSGECCIAGDAWGVLSRHMDSADALVLVAPVYFAGPSGWLKAALDRCQVYWARKYVLHVRMPPQRPAHLLVVGEGGDPFGSGPLEAICTSALNCANLRIAPERTHRFIADGYDLSRATEVADAVLEGLARPDASDAAAQDR